jgi:hypothetical protein
MKKVKTGVEVSGPLCLVSERLRPENLFTACGESYGIMTRLTNYSALVNKHCHYGQQHKYLMIL